jgi:alkylation response protein AidB-like acyl-CoA dehydrogenase
MIDLELSDEQCELVEGASSLLKERSPASTSHRAGAHEDLHAVLADWGWFRVGLPESSGGLNLGMAEEVLLCLQAGRFLLPPSVLATTLAARLADAPSCGQLLDGRQRAALLMARGEDVAYCFDRGHAALLVVIESNGISLYSAEAFSGELIAGLDETVAMEKGRLARRTCLARESGHRAVLLSAAMLAGIASAACDLAVEYAKTRQQFGQPIGAFQAIKHRCADMALRAFAAEAQVRMAAVSAAERVRSPPFQVAAAARNAIIAARTNSAGAIQVHGGLGFTVECAAHLYLKRSHLLSELIGGTERQEAALLACPAPEGA